MSPRRCYWGIVFAGCLAGVIKWFDNPGAIEVFWLIVWSVTGLVAFEAFLNNRSLSWEKKDDAKH